MREGEEANRTRVAGHLDEIQSVVTNTLSLFRNGAVGFIDWLDGLRRVTHSLDKLWFDPNGVMTAIWCLRAVIQDVQLEMAVFPKAVNPECLADDAVKQLRCTNASCVIQF